MLIDSKITVIRNIRENIESMISEPSAKASGTLRNRLLTALEYPSSILLCRLSEALADHLQQELLVEIGLLEPSIECMVLQAADQDGVTIRPVATTLT